MPHTPTTVGGILVAPPTREGEQSTEHTDGTCPPQCPFEGAVRPAGQRDETEDPDRPGRQQDAEEPQRGRSDEEEPGCMHIGSYATTRL